MSTIDQVTARAIKDHPLRCLVSLYVVTTEPRSQPDTLAHLPAVRRRTPSDTRTRHSFGSEEITAGHLAIDWGRGAATQAKWRRNSLARRIP